jgi:MFS transporter, PAT family, beta-lactamase induction signal transducer AmpG
MAPDVLSNPQETATDGRPWWWVPSLYFAQAIPYVLVMTVLGYPYKRLEVSAIVIGYTSWLGLPWTFKPLWSPLIDLIGTERRWVWATELAASGAMAILACGYMSQNFLFWTLIGYGLLAMVSATHDIAADGFYMRALKPHDQTWFAGIRSVAFRGGYFYCASLLVTLAGLLIRFGWEPRTAWAITHGVASATYLLLATYHALMLPTPEKVIRDQAVSVSAVLVGVGTTFRKYFAAIPLATALPFLLLYRFAEAQVVKFIGVFLLDSRANGGLGFLEDQIGLTNSFGIAALVSGGVLGGMLASRDGLRAWLFPMAIMMNLTNVAYLALAYYQPASLAWVGVAVVIENFGYGLGFTAYVMYMLYLSQGENQTSFYAICTGIMALGLIAPGSLAGYPVKWFGYTGFFVWILIATIPSFLATWIACRGMDPNFGRRQVVA